MKSVVAVLILFFVSYALPSSANETSPDLSIRLHHENDQWHVYYEFKEPQTAVFFWRSLGDYRTSTWNAISANTHIDRFNGLDTIWFDRPTSSAEFIIEPRTDLISSEYTPFIKFSGSQVAVFTGQFEVALNISKGQIKALNGKSHLWNEAPTTKQIEILSDQPLINNGEVHKNIVKDDFTNNAKYIYVGDGEITHSDHFVGIIDEQMPQWIRQQLHQNTPLIFDVLSDKYKHRFNQKIDLLYAFKGTDHSGFSNKGGILGKQSMVLESSGSLFLKENKRLINALQFTLAHEGAHLFQNVKASNSNNKANAWIHEGGADFIAFQTLLHAELLTRDQLQEKVINSFTLCTDFLLDDVLPNSVLKGSQAHYHCGHIIAYITDAALPDHSYIEFWPALIENAISSEQWKGKRYTAKTYYDTMVDLGADQTIITAIKHLVSEPQNNAKKSFSELMLNVGLDAVFNDDNDLVEFNTNH